MTSAFSWRNSTRLCPASFCTPRPNLPVTPGISWLPTFAFQSPIMKRTLFWVLVIEDLVGLHRTIQLQLLQCYWLGHRRGLLWYWMVCLGDEQRSFCFFEIASKYCISASFVDHDGYSISSEGFLPTVVDIMVPSCSRISMWSSSTVMKLNMESTTQLGTIFCTLHGAKWLSPHKQNEQKDSCLTY